MKNRCPYCNQNINTSHSASAYMLKPRDHSLYSEMKKHHADLFDILEEFQGSRTNEDSRNRYVELHQAFGGSQDSAMLTGDEIFFTGYEWDSFRERVEHLLRDQQKDYRPEEAEHSAKNAASGLAAHSTIRVSEETVKDIAAGDAEAEGRYSFRDNRSRQDGKGFDNREKDLLYGGTPLAYIRRVCPQCCHLLPQELLLLPIYRVLLVAPPECGKTSALQAIYGNIDNFNRVLGGEIMHINPIQDVFVDEHFRRFMEQTDLFKRAQDHYIPEQNRLAYRATAVGYIPPLFLRADYMTEENEVRSVILAIYDCGGELYNPERDLSDVYLNADRVRTMDALWVMVDAGKAYGRSGMDDLKLTSEEFQEVRSLKEHRVLSTDEQKQVEASFARDSFQIGEMIDYYLILADSKRSEDQIRPHMERQDMRTRSHQVLTTLFRRVGGREVMRDVAQQLDLAMIVTKADYLKTSPQIRQEDKECFYEMKGSYFDPEELDNREIRRFIMDDWVSEWNLLEFDSTAFRSVEYHFIAARTESNFLRFAPIRVEEPLVYAVKNYMERTNEE